MAKNKYSSLIFLLFIFMIVTISGCGVKGDPQPAFKDSPPDDTEPLPSPSPT